MIPVHELHLGSIQTRFDSGDVSIEYLSAGESVSLPIGKGLHSASPEVVIGYPTKDRLGGSQCLATTRSIWPPKLMSSKRIRNSATGSYSMAVEIHTADNHLSHYEWVGLIQVFNVVNSSQSTFVGFSMMPPAVECN
jgi:hypothetical protein